MALFLGVCLLGCGDIQCSGEKENESVLTASVPESCHSYQLLKGKSDSDFAFAMPSDDDKTVEEITEEERQTLEEFCSQYNDEIAVYVHDLSSDQIYIYNESSLYYPASTLKAAYALWLCEQADGGMIDFSEQIPNIFGYGLQDSAIPDYASEESIPVETVMQAMLSVSDNDCTTLLDAVWPGEEEFRTFLTDLGIENAQYCSITRQSGIEGMLNVDDAGKVMDAIYRYCEGNTPNAQLLKRCITQAKHDILYVPEGVTVAKKYGSWENAYHDWMIVYAEHPYVLCCMTRWGTSEEEFPAEPTEIMQQLGKLIYQITNG